MRTSLPGPQIDQRIYAKAEPLLSRLDRGASWKLMTHATFDNGVNK